MRRSSAGSRPKTRPITTAIARAMISPVRFMLVSSIGPAPIWKGGLCRCCRCRHGSRGSEDGFPEARAPAGDGPIGKARSNTCTDHGRRLIVEFILFEEFLHRQPADPARERAVRGMVDPRTK